MAIQSPLEESCIPTFIAQYEQEKYELLAQRVADICKQVLSKTGIDFRTRGRGKKPESLRIKLEKRERERESGPYKDLKEIYDEIIDLAGARIILDRSGDRHIVKDILYDTFEVSREKLMDRETGYRAVHYVVYLKQDQSSSDLLMANARTPIEIQIQSQGVWQWSKLEHDGIYKAKKDPSRSRQFVLNNYIRLLNIVEDHAEEARELIAEEDAKEEEELAKSKEKLKGSTSVGHHLEEWIPKQAADWAKDWAKDKSINSGSVTALTKLLYSQKWMSVEFLDRLLKKHLGDGAQDEYSELAREFNRIKFDPVIYLIDREIMQSEGNESSPFQYLDSDKEQSRKIRVIFSTFYWMNCLFVRPFEWHRLLAQLKDQEILRPGILWLSNSARQCNIEDGASVLPDEIHKLKGLWDWFSESRNRPIKLAFTMSNMGLTIDTPKEEEELRGALEPLVEGLSQVGIRFELSGESRHGEEGEINHL